MKKVMLGKIGKKGGVTLRAVLIGLAFMPINVYLVVQWETVWGTQYPTTMGIFFNAIFCLFLVTALNLPIKKFFPNSAISQGEVLTIYTILLMAITVSGHDFTQTIFCTLGTCRWFATPENEWNSLFARYLPQWLTVNDENVLRGFYEGESTFYTVQHIKGWLEPMLWWTLFLTVMVFTMLCINVIIRKQWIEREKLTYPLVQLPFEMTLNDSKKNFFSNKLLWLGFGVAAGIDIINGLNFLFPIFPKIPLIYNLGEHFVDKPFNTIGSFPIQINPYAIGLAFPIPLDLLFSCWFLFIVWKAESVIGSIAGVNLPEYPFPDQQILGSYLGIAAVALFMGKKSLWQVMNQTFSFPKRKSLNKKKRRGKMIKKAIGIGSDVDDSGEPMKYRTAVFGAILGTASLVIFASQAGMSILFPLAFFLIYFAIMFAFTRMRAELGPPLQGIHYSGPLQLIVATVGSRKISPQTLTVAAPYWTFTKELRNNPMPFVLEGFKLAERADIDTQKLWKVMMLSTLLGIFVTFWAFLQFNYKWGGVGAWRGVAAYTVIERWVTRPVEPDATFLIATGFGFIVVLINTVLRLRFLWWRLHPLGYPLAGYYHFDKLWFPFFISWAAKGIILKYGGIRAYRRTFPLFMGLILGEFIMGSVWGILGLLTGKPTYAFKNW
ncbi:hypothetical protein FJZ31_16250 [Candidatus Poribacteria bacterium]|nr:hypothetical protein [Candidatus Poribacteria bacterium]